MGSVYQVLDRELDEEVALKVLTPEAFAEGTQAVQTLKQEIRLARKITHPNVVRTHDLGEADGLRFLTMEYVPGTTLRELLDRRGAVALAPGLQIAKQLCRGLTAIHEAGIIHRDIKPQNIMVLPNGVVKVMDFGIARTAEGSDHPSLEGQTVGTPYYMSPEQALGRDLDARSDLYTVGVVLFELFTGQRPFLGKEAAEVMHKHVSAEPPRPTSLRPDLPDYLERLDPRLPGQAPRPEARERGRPLRRADAGRRVASRVRRARRSARRPARGPPGGGLGLRRLAARRPPPGELDLQLGDPRLQALDVLRLRRRLGPARGAGAAFCLRVSSVRSRNGRACARGVKTSFAPRCAESAASAYQERKSRKARSEVTISSRRNGSGSSPFFWRASSWMICVRITRVMSSPDLRVDDLHLGSLADQLGDLGQVDVAARRRVVETAVLVLPDHDGLAS